MSQLNHFIPVNTSEKDRKDFQDAIDQEHTKFDASLKRVKQRINEILNNFNIQQTFTLETYSFKDYDSWIYKFFKNTTKKQTLPKFITQHKAENYANTLYKQNTQRTATIEKKKKNRKFSQFAGYQSCSEPVQDIKFLAFFEKDF